FFQAEDGIRDFHVTGVQTCALPISGEQLTMADYPLEGLLDEDNTKIIYVYDFINMWTFLIELASIEPEEPGATYPEVLFAHGQRSEERRVGKYWRAG